MTFPADYSQALNELQISRHFPNLKAGENFRFTSLKTEDYNCVAWVDSTTDDWVQFYDENDRVITRVERYIEYFLSMGFIETDSSAFEDNVLKSSPVAISTMDLALLLVSAGSFAFFISQSYNLCLLGQAQK